MYGIQRPKIILASKSQRRKEILEHLGIKAEIMVSCADENLNSDVPPEEYVEIISRRKAEAVSKMLSAMKTSLSAEQDFMSNFHSAKNNLNSIKNSGEPEQNSVSPIIIACDTAVYVNGKILGKPKNKADAMEMITELSDTTHSVISGLTVLQGDKTVTEHETTYVKFRKISLSEADLYTNTDEPYDKAGGYGIQDKAAVFVEGLNGDYLNVVGLPVYKLFSILKKDFGTDYFNLTRQI